MLSEGLRQELPELFALAERLRPRIARTRPVWALLAAIGAAALADAAVRTVAIGIVAVASLGPPSAGPGLPIPFLAGQIAAGAAAVLVALAAGGGAALLLYVGYEALLIGIGLMGLVVFFPACPPDLVCPQYTGEVQASVFNSWPLAAGVLLGLLLRRMPAASRGTNGMLEALGAMGIMALPLGLFGLYNTATRGAGGDLWILVVAATALVRVTLGALVLTRRDLRPLRSALVIAAIMLVAWAPLGVPQLQMLLSGPPIEDARVAFSVAAGPVEYVLLVALTALVASSRRRSPA